MSLHLVLHLVYYTLSLGSIETSGFEVLSVEMVSVQYETTFV